MIQILVTTKEAIDLQKLLTLVATADLSTSPQELQEFARTRLLHDLLNQIRVLIKYSEKKTIPGVLEGDR